VALRYVTDADGDELRIPESWTCWRKGAWLYRVRDGRVEAQDTRATLARWRRLEAA